MAIPKKRSVTYNQSIPGVYGVFGAGGGLRAFYIQATITPAELDNIKLISEIPGSEKWPIQDLFQRDVDNERISEGLLPYLKKEDKIKFFNPLTITMLPMDEDGHTILKQMPEVIEGSHEEDERTWKTLERQGFFKLSWTDDNDAYSTLEWNTKQTKLVAIDGQHRLSAMKRFQRDNAAEGHPDFTTWRIPIVVVSFQSVVDKKEPPSVLDVVRNLFVYINSEAHKVNEARKILLSDSNVVNICTQEIVQDAHANDSSDEPNPTKIPLLFYDWRGEEKKKESVKSEVAVKNVNEINNWLSNYILDDEEFSPRQKSALKVVPTNPLNDMFVEKKIKYDHVRLIREQFKKVLLPAISYLISNFVPYQAYISKLRDLEKQQLESGDIGSHALSQLRFGSNMAPDDIRIEVDKRKIEIEEEVLKIKNNEIGELLLDDIGMRGVVSAFGTIYEIMDTPKEWFEYAKWFTDTVNAVFDAGWLDKTGKLGKKYLRHITFDHNDTTINYRVDQASNSLGAYVEYLVSQFVDIDKSKNVDWDQVADSALSRMGSTLLRGYKRESRVILKEQDEYRDGGQPLTLAVAARSEKHRNKHITSFKKAVVKSKEQG